VYPSRILQSIDDYIVRPWFGAHAGVIGALALAQRATGSSAS